MSHIVVVGGGISGLATAYYLVKEAARRGQAIEPLLVEAEERLGGKIVTHRRDGFVVEGAPDSFLTQKPWALDLARELGLADRFVAIASTEPARILVRGKLQPIPAGLALLVPTRWKPFLRSPIVSWPGKLRLLLDLAIPSRRSDGDESLASFIRRRLGPEMLDVFGEPLLAGIYAADPERLSLEATFPRFREMERRSGSLLRDAWKTSRDGRKQESKPGAPRSPFVSFRGGMAELVEALDRALGERAIRGHRAVELRRGDRADGKAGYKVALDDGTVLPADAVVLAVPAYAAADLVERINPDLAAGLRRIRYVSTATVSLGYRRADVPMALKSSGFVISAGEGRRITACTWSSTKFPGRAPEGQVLLRAFVGDARDEASAGLDEAALIRLARDELRELMDIQAEPVLAEVFRWPRAMPQYEVGHLDRVAALERACSPGLFLVGTAYRGIGIPDCVHAAQLAAASALVFLSSARPKGVANARDGADT